MVAILAENLMEILETSMKVLYSWKDERCEAAISDDSDWMLFNGVAEAILRRLKEKLVERLDGTFPVRTNVRGRTPAGNRPTVGLTESPRCGSFTGPASGRFD